MIILTELFSFIKIKIPVLTVEYYNHVKDYIHRHLHTFIEDYQNENLITLPPFHGCGHRNRNGTNKLHVEELLEKRCNAEI